MAITLFVLWNIVNLQSNGIGTQLTPTGSYTTPIIVADTTGSYGTVGMFAQVSIAVGTQNRGPVGYAAIQ